MNRRVFDSGFTANRRFDTSVDPIVSAYSVFDPQRFNRYAFARNNPGFYVDPDGCDIVFFAVLMTNQSKNSVPSPYDFQFPNERDGVMFLREEQDNKVLGPGVGIDGGMYMKLNTLVVFSGDAKDYGVTRDAYVIDYEGHRGPLVTGRDENPTDRQISNRGPVQFVWDSPGARPKELPTSGRGTAVLPDKGAEQTKRHDG